MSEPSPLGDLPGTYRTLVEKATATALRAEWLWKDSSERAAQVAQVSLALSAAAANLAQEMSHLVEGQLILEPDRIGAWAEH